MKNLKITVIIVLISLGAHFCYGQGNNGQSGLQYEIQYSLVDVVYSQDTLYSTSCLLSLIGEPNVDSIEVFVGTVPGGNQISSITVAKENGLQLSLFQGGTRAMLSIGNLPFAPLYHYQVRLKYANNSWSAPLQITSTPN